MMTVLLNGWRFYKILDILEIKISFRESLLIFISGLSMLLTPGTSGSLIKSYILKLKKNSTISSTTPIIIYEKWLEFVSIIIIIGSFLLYSSYLESIILFSLGVGLSVLSFFILKDIKGLNFLNSLLSKSKFTSKYRINVDEFHATTKKLFCYKTILWMLGLTILGKLIVTLAIFVIFSSFSIPVDFFNSGQIFFTSTLIGLLTFVPGGIIVVETGMIGLLLREGVEFTTASISVLVVRLIVLWIPIILGFISLKFALNLKNEK